MLISLVLLGFMMQGETPAEDATCSRQGSCLFEYGLGEFTGGAECARRILGGEAWEAIHLHSNSWRPPEGDEAGLAWLDSTSYPQVELLQAEFRLGDLHKAGLRDSVGVWGGLTTTRSLYMFDTGTLTVATITDSSIVGSFAFETMDASSSSMARGPRVAGCFHAKRAIPSKGRESGIVEE